jgi:hypothetical protein
LVCVLPLLVSVLPLLVSVLPLLVSVLPLLFKNATTQPKILTMELWKLFRKIPNHPNPGQNPTVMAKLGTELEERNLAFLASSVQLLSV